MGKLLDNLRKKHAATRSKASRHTANFLAHRDEIAEAMREGWTAKQIWEQLIEDGMTTMSYASLCRYIKKYITPSMYDATTMAMSIGAAPSLHSPSMNKNESVDTKKSISPKRKPTEKERLDLLKEEAFASVRSSKSAGPLIDKPKSREEESRELFG